MKPTNLKPLKDAYETGLVNRYTNACKDGVVEGHYYVEFDRKLALIGDIFDSMTDLNFDNSLIELENVLNLPL